MTCIGVLQERHRKKETTLNLKTRRWRLSKILVILKLSLILPILSSIFVGNAFAQKGLSVAFVAGPGTPSPLLDLVRVKKINLVSQWNSTLALKQRFFQSNEWYALEMEAQISQYYDAKNSQSAQAAFIVRWFNPPWNKLRPSSFAVGVGPSYAIQTPELEKSLNKQSHLLLHLLIEYTTQAYGAWDALLRVQHRSGIFGLVEDVIGGSDYLCLGARYNF